MAAILSSRHSANTHVLPVSGPSPAPRIGSPGHLKPKGSASMTPEEAYFFDLTGFLLIRNVVSPDELRQAVATVDELEEHVLKNIDSAPVKKGTTTQNITSIHPTITLHQGLVQAATESSSKIL
jgi:hypothetical protein